MFSGVNASQGSVATYAKSDAIFNKTTLVQVYQKNLPVKEFCKSVML